MGSTTSVIEQKQLFNQITECLDENISLKEDESPSKNEQQDVDIYNRVNDLYQKWLYQQFMGKSVIRTPLIDFEKHFLLSLDDGKTPFLIDESSDKKLLTYYSYQHTSILDAKKVVTDYLIKKQPLIECMDYCRRCLVNAMKHGKLLVIHLDTSAPDFINTFNDDNLQKTTKLDDPSLAYFPIDLFYEGGKRLISNDWVKRLFREDDMLPHKNFAICR